MENHIKLQKSVQFVKKMPNFITHMNVIFKLLGEGGFLNLLCNVLIVENGLKLMFL